MVVALLGTLGVLGGYGVGRAADAVRAVLPDGDPGLPADKVAPPEPIDLTGPATTCRADAVDLTLSAATPTATLGDSLVFTVRVTNTGRVPCLVDGGAGSRTVTVTEMPAAAAGRESDDGAKQSSSEGSEGSQASEKSGESGDDAAGTRAEGERVWSSGDCTDSETMLLLGVDHVAEQEVRWRTERSTAKCADDPPALEPGTYQAYAELGDVPGVRSEPVTVTVLAPPEPSKAASPPAEDGDAKGAGGSADAKDGGDAKDGDDTTDAGGSGDGAGAKDAETGDGQQDGAEG